MTNEKIIEFNEWENSRFPVKIKKTDIVHEFSKGTKILKVEITGVGAVRQSVSKSTLAKIVELFDKDYEQGPDGIKNMLSIPTGNDSCEYSIRYFA